MVQKLAVIQKTVLVKQIGCLILGDLIVTEDEYEMVLNFLSWIRSRKYGRFEATRVDDKIDIETSHRSRHNIKSLGEYPYV